MPPKKLKEEKKAFKKEILQFEKKKQQRLNEKLKNIGKNLSVYC